MAIALRGAAVIPTGGQGNPTTGYTVTIPAQVAVDDLLFLTLTSRDSVGAGSIAVSDNEGAGGNAWVNFAHSSTDYKLTLWWRRATAGTASKTLTVSGCVGSCSGVLKAFSGASTEATPYADVVFETNASADETHAGFTPTRGHSMVCAAICNYANDNAVSTLSFATTGATTMTECLSTGGSDCANAFGHVLQAGQKAATGDLTWAQTNGTTYSAVWTILPAAFTTTGTLTSDASTLSGAAAHKTLHTNSGVLVGQGSTVIGASAHQHVTSGILSGPDSIVIGTAVHSVTATFNAAWNGAANSLIQ